MRDRFPHKSPGDSLEAEHINRLSDVARRVGNARPGSFISGQHTDSFFSISGQPPWQQFALVVTDDRIDDSDTADSGLFLGKSRYFDPDAAIWKTDDDNEYEIDTSDLDVTVGIGTKLVCWWDSQRGMFVPTNSDRLHNPLVDYGADLFLDVARTGFPGSEIRFSLELSSSGIGGWGTINSREYSSNNIARRALENEESPVGGSLTGCGFFTFAVSGTMWVRAVCQTDVRYGLVKLDTAALRLEAKGEGVMFGALGPPFAPATIVPGWWVEAFVNLNNLAAGYPIFTREPLGGLVKIEVPEGQTWVIEAELTMGFDFDEESTSSTSSTSTSSVSTSSVSSSSISTSSVSSSSLSTSSSSSPSSSTSSSSPSSSSISTSSISTSSSSSVSTSSLSESSSAGLTHQRVVVDVCCDGPNLVIVTQDLLFDAAGHFVGATERDPADSCSEAP